MLSRLNDMQEIAQIRGPATQWFCEVAERAGRALPAFLPDCPILFDDIRRNELGIPVGFSGPRPVINRDPAERWVGFVFGILKQRQNDALRVKWGTEMAPLSYGLATLDRDLCAASVLAIDLTGLIPALDENESPAPISDPEASASRRRPNRVIGITAPPLTTPVASGLIHFDLPTIFRCAVELAEAVAAVIPADWESLPVNIEGPASPHFERWCESHRRLTRIEEESGRLKQSLGATGPLRFADIGADADEGRSDGESAKWESYERRFADTAHDRIVRLALMKLSTAAIDLSGFATWREPQWAMKETGFRLLTWGLAQLWEGMSAEERSSVQDRLQRTNKAVGWPRDPTAGPPSYDGPEEILPEDQYRVIDTAGGYITCYQDYWDDVQKASNDRVRQGHERFLRWATLTQLVEAADRAAQAIGAMAKGRFDTPREWGDLYTKAFWPLACLRRAKEISPFEDWSADAIEQRNLLADAAGLLLVYVGGTPEAKEALKPEDVEKSLADFTTATNRLREIANREFAHHLTPADEGTGARRHQAESRQAVEVQPPVPLSSPPSGDGPLAFQPGAFVYRNRRFPLKGKPLEVLRELAEARERPRTVNDLLKAVWPNSVITEDTVRTAVSHARNALRAAMRDVRISAPKDPIPAVDRGTGRLAWRLDLP